MSYIYNDKFSFQDGPQMDSFGRLRTSNISTLLEVKHVYDKNSILEDEVIGGTGATSIHVPIHSDVEMSVTQNGDYVIRQTKTRAIYQAGKSAFFKGTMSDFHVESNVVKRMGYFSNPGSTGYHTSFDGIFLQSCGVTGGTGAEGTYGISFQVWQEGIQTVNIPLSQWDTNVMDPSTIDWTKVQLFWFDFQWLGAGRIRFGLYESVGQIVFGSYTAANQEDDVYMKSPNQPIRYEILSKGGAGSFHQICSTFEAEGSINSIYKSYSLVDTTERNFGSTATKYAYVGYRIKDGFEGINLILDSVSSLSPSTSHDFLVTLELNPTLASVPTWNSPANEPLEYAYGSTGLTATVISSSGKILGGWHTKGGNQAAYDFITSKDGAILPGTAIDGTQDEIWICLQPQTLNNSRIRSSITNIQYYT